MSIFKRSVGTKCYFAHLLDFCFTLVEHKTQKEKPMASRPQRNKPPLVNVIILLFAAAASLATLKGSNGHSGQSWTRAEWSGDSQSILVTVEPVSDRLDAFDYGGPLYIDLEMSDILENAADLVSWNLSMDTSSGEAFSLSGGFTFDDYSGSEDEHGLYGNISTRVAPLCADAGDTTSGCIPCFIEEGCTLSIDVDLCYTNTQEHMNIGISIAQSDGEIFSNECAEGGDVEPCETLDAWIEAETAPLATSLCAEGSLSGELIQ
jgi:hypothetical protein